MIRLHQAFYGRDPDKGYRLLASSNAMFNETVSELCAAIGTPDGISSVDDFYLNFIADGYRYMISVCNGNPDAGGRKTLFFHAYIGRHEELCSANFGIGSLIHIKAFEKEYKTGPVLEKTFEESAFSLPWGKTAIVWNHEEKLAIRSSKPDLMLISGILKNNLDKTTWSSFAFKPLDRFQIYVISEYVSTPSDRKCVSVSGAVISNVKRPPRSITTTPSQSRPKSSRSRGGLLIVLMISIIINIAFAFYVFSKPEAVVENQGKTSATKENSDKRTATPTQSASTTGNTPRMPVTRGTTREEVIRELRAEFEKNYVRLNCSWRKAMHDDRALQLQFEKYRKDPLIKAEGYIDFVHKYIFEEKETQK